MRRSRANQFKAKAEMALAHDPEARREIKGQGLTVGKRVLYYGEGEPAATRYGTVREMHLKSVEIEVTVGNIMTGGENAVIRKDEVPYARITEIVGDGRLADRTLEPTWNKPHEHGGPGPAPPRSEGYEECELGGKRGCGERPYKAYSIRKLDRETGVLGPSRIIAICKPHDEPYVESKGQGKDHEPAHIPLLWQLGVVFEEYTIPREKGETDPQRISPQTEAFENCWCGKEYGHRGFHRKTEDEDG